MDFKTIVMNILESPIVEYVKDIIEIVISPSVGEKGPSTSLDHLYKPDDTEIKPHGVDHLIPSDMGMDATFPRMSQEEWDARVKLDSENAKMGKNGSNIPGIILFVVMGGITVIKIVITLL